MAEVIEYKIDGFKVFYYYMDDIIEVCVNHQSQFKAGQRDVIRDGRLTESQATEARSMEAHETTLPKSYAKYYRNRLQVNGFDLEKE